MIGLSIYFGAVHKNDYSSDHRSTDNSDSYDLSADPHFKGLIGNLLV